MNTQQWRALLRDLRKHFPVEQQAVVKRCPRIRNHGMTRFDGRRYHIYIMRDQDKAGMIDTLLHEWAHVRAIEQAYQHDGPWGAIYAEIYTAWSHDFDAHID